MTKIAVIDYGAGNLFSIARALEHCGATPVFTADPDSLRKADRAILPGVGAFGDGMAALRQASLSAAIAELAAAGNPVLGICLGMQMLFDASEEFGDHTGLALIPGRVLPLPRTRADGAPQKVPHIGWNDLCEPAPGRWAGTPLAAIAPGTSAYFVHSFAAVPADGRDAIATCVYGGHAITAAVQRDNVCGCQFHPERSGPAGLSIIRQFLA